MKKDLKYYLSKRYPIEVNPIPPEDGGGYETCIPQLGRYAFVGTGDTIKEAIENLESFKREMFRDYLEKGVQIPEPRVVEEDFSGKFVVRIPKILHSELVKMARDNNVSLNQFVVYLISTNFEKFKSESQMNLILTKLEPLSEIWDSISNYSLPGFLKTQKEEYEDEYPRLV